MYEWLFSCERYYQFKDSCQQTGVLTLLMDHFVMDNRTCSFSSVMHWSASQCKADRLRRSCLIVGLVVSPITKRIWRLR